MIWYQYIFLVIAVALYSLKDAQQFWGLKWSKHQDDFWGAGSWKRKYKDWHKDDRRPRFFGSTTFLIMFTDGVHLMQFIMKACFSIGIFGLTWWSVLAFTLWTGIQWGVFKLFSK